MQKRFKQMSANERNEWLEKFQPWYAESLPEIESAKSVGPAERKLFDEGLKLLEVFPSCNSFVTETRRFRDYRSRKKLLRRLADNVARDAQKELGLTGKVDLTDPKLLKPHVGRPTKEEAEARKIKAERDRKERESKEKTLFGTMADIPTVKPVAPGTVSGSVAGGSLLHLDQLKWLMSDALKEAVGTVRTLRATAAEAATKAKQMALDGRKAEEIKPYTDRAIRDTEAYENIYEQVDKEMAKVYVRLKEDSAYIAKMEEMKVDIQQLRAQLRPYFDKQPDKELFRKAVVDEIDFNDPEQKAKREKEKERRAEVLNIIKYIMRKDKPNTPRRIAELQRRYEQLVKIAGEDYAKDYLPVIEAAKANPVVSPSSTEPTKPTKPTEPNKPTKPTTPTKPATLTKSKKSKKRTKAKKLINS